MLRRFLDNIATPGLLIGLLLVTAAFYGLDQFLANLERREIAAEAQRLAAAGDSLLRQGRNSDAIDAFQRAHVTERDNRGYQLSLARALLADAQPRRAVAVLDDVLEDDSNDGSANLLMARATTAQGQFQAADAYYHRAIYGSWAPGQRRESIQARVELVRWLAQRGDQQALLAELIPLEQRAQSDPAIARQLPALYLQAGSLTQAEGAYRALIHNQPDQSEPYAGLARVELQKGNFRAAQQDFNDAVLRNPDDTGLGREAETATSAHELDPTSRHLASAEKFARGQRILAMSIDAVQGCAPDAESLASAQKLLAEKPPKSPSNEMAEVRLDLAAKLWRSRPLSCKSAPDHAEVLAVLVRKIEQ